MDPALIASAGGQEHTPPDKFTPIAFFRQTAGLATQRTPFAGFPTSRSDYAFYHGRPEALESGLNVEVSNRLTIQRRPGMVAYGVSNIPSPDFFYPWNTIQGDINLVIDTQYSGGDNSVGAAGGVLRYSPTSSGIYINKTSGSLQTNFLSVDDTLYLGDGFDLFKVVGPNLLTQSNTFGTGAGTSFGIQAPWVETDIFSLTPNESPDPLGGSNATQILFSTTGGATNLHQVVVPNYTPVASNTYTFSLWAKQTGGANGFDLYIGDQNGEIAQTVVTLTSTWTKYSVTATMNSNSTSIVVGLYDATATTAFLIYGAQLEIGGPATTTQITTTKPQGVWLWGITPPTAAPTFTTTNAVGNTGKAWQPDTNYLVGQTIVDQFGNLQYATFGGIYGSPSFALTSVAGGTGVYQGTISDLGYSGAGNAFVNMPVTIAGFTHAANNGNFTITASSATSITVNNASSVLETHAGTAQIGIAGTTAGTSGTAQPTFNQSEGSLTLDGLQNILVQSVTSTSGTVGTGATASVTLPQAVTASNTLLVAVFVSHPGSLSISDNKSNSYSLLKTSVAGQFELYLYTVASAASGSTTISVTGGGSDGTYIAAVEMSELTGKDTGGSAFHLLR